MEGATVMVITLRSGYGNTHLATITPHDSLYHYLFPYVGKRRFRMAQSDWNDVITRIEFDIDEAKLKRAKLEVDIQQLRTGLYTDYNVPVQATKSTQYVDLYAVRLRTLQDFLVGLDSLDIHIENLNHLSGRVATYRDIGNTFADEPNADNGLFII